MNINPVIETASTDEVTSVLADSKKTFLNEISKYVEEGISTQKELLHFQRVGSDYFNGAVSLIQKYNCINWTKIKILRYPLLVTVELYLKHTLYFRISWLKQLKY